MEISIYDFLKAVDESNRAYIMALRCAVSILEDFINLSLDGRKVMADTLMNLISQKKKKSDVEKCNLKLYSRTKPEFLIRLIPCLP